jgi:hypothetical protein
MKPNITDEQINEAIQSTLSDFPDDARDARLHSDAASYLFLSKAVMQKLPPATMTDADAITRLFLLFGEQRMSAMFAGDMSNPGGKLPAFVDIMVEAVELGAKLATSVHTQRPIAPDVSPVIPARPKFLMEVS